MRQRKVNVFSALPGNCWGWDRSRWGEMCLTDAADTLSKLVIIHNIGCVNIINIINIINWNITLALLPAAEEGQLNSGQLPDHDCVCVPGPGVCPCLLSALCSSLPSPRAAVSCPIVQCCTTWSYGIMLFGHWKHRH